MEWVWSYGTGNVTEKETKCESCGATKKEEPSIKLQVNPYTQELHNDHNLYLLCDKCVYRSIRDI